MRRSADKSPPAIIVAVVAHLPASVAVAVAVVVAGAANAADLLPRLRHKRRRNSARQRRSNADHAKLAHVRDPGPLRSRRGAAPTVASRSGQSSSGAKLRRSARRSSESRPTDAARSGMTAVRKSIPATAT